MEKTKKPMTKAKKEFIAGFIWLAAAAMFIITGAIMLAIPKENWELIFGVVILCCGSAMIGLSAYMIIKNWRIMKIEKSA